MASASLGWACDGIAQRAKSERRVEKFEIRNSKFEISVGGRHSEFRIPNSEFNSGVSKGRVWSKMGAMKVYTRTGDGGETSLLSGGRVRKDDLRVEAYGTVDEL